MTAETGYTLEQLAREFGLTPRTARHYIEKLLPPHHKQGRGKQARYGQDTRNCFDFIRKTRTQKFTTAQISSLLRALSQEQIDRVAYGVEELAIVPRPGEEPVELASSPCMAGDFPEFSMADRDKPSLNDISYLEHGVTDIAAGPSTARRDVAGSRSGPTPRWRVLYFDDELQITHHGEATPEQRDRLRLAVTLIKRILQ
jgi:DNA-binding transcriptional MerR regulator